MQGLFFNNREWLALFLTVDHTITDGGLMLYSLKLAKYLCPSKKIHVFLLWLSNL